MGDLTVSSQSTSQRTTMLKKAQEQSGLDAENFESIFVKNKSADQKLKELAKSTGQTVNLNSLLNAYNKAGTEEEKNDILYITGYKDVDELKKVVDFGTKWDKEIKEGKHSGWDEFEGALAEECNNSSNPFDSRPVSSYLLNANDEAGGYVQENTEARKDSSDQTSNSDSGSNSASKNIFGLGDKSVKLGDNTSSVMDSAHQFNEKLKANHDGKLTLQDVAKELFNGDEKAAELACGVDGNSKDISDLDIASVLSMADMQFENRTDGTIDSDEWQAAQKSLSERSLDDSNKGILKSIGDYVKEYLAKQGYNKPNSSTSIE